MEEVSYRAARLLRVVGHPLRYRIVELLSHQHLTSLQIARALKRKQPTVSNSLSTLKKIDVVSYKRIDERLVYWLKVPEVTALIEWARKCVRKTQRVG